MTENAECTPLFGTLPFRYLQLYAWVITRNNKADIGLFITGCTFKIQESYDVTYVAEHINVCRSFTWLKFVLKLRNFNYNYSIYYLNFVQSLVSELFQEQCFSDNHNNPWPNKLKFSTFSDSKLSHFVSLTDIKKPLHYSLVQLFGFPKKALLLTSDDILIFNILLTEAWQKSYFLTLTLTLTLESCQPIYH